MQNQVFNLKSEIKSIITDEETVKISGYASTSNLDRAGDVILPSAWTNGLENFKKNPILLFNHDYNRPIGKVTDFRITEKGLEIDGDIVDKEVAYLIKNEVLKAFSVGFLLKDADYDSNVDTFFINEAELYEVSVVSVPCNQDAVFSVSKSFKSDADYREFLKQFNPVVEDSVNTQDSTEGIKEEEIEMDVKEMQEMLKTVAAETAKSLLEAQKAEAAEKAKAEAAEKAADADFSVKVTTAAEKLMADVEKRFFEKNESLESIVSELKEELASKSAEIEKMRDSKRHFSDRTGSADWKKEFAADAADAYVLGLATGKGWSTGAAKQLIEKVNAFSGVAVSSADFEQLVSTNIERDIQNALVLAPLFRELPMNSATAILPILPDAGYAEFVATSTTDASAPKGNLDMRSATYGTEAGVTMGERVVSTKKLMSLSYLGNETEEDAIIPILPLIRESMVRSHARAVEQAILLGNHADGIYGTSGASFDGLVKLAVADSNYTTPTGTYAATDVVTAANLFSLRKNMGKYGLRPEDVVYIVSQDVYFNLLEDAEFQDANLVGEMTATKLKGKIGSVYGSNVIVCDEFAAKAASKFNAIAVNTRNFLVPRLRGITIESDYETKEQRRVLVATQRLGFIDLIDGAAAKWALSYKAS